MFQKLLKYEFKSIGKWYLALYGVIGVMSISLGLWVQNIILREEHNIETFNTGLMNIEGILFAFSIIAFFLIIGFLFISTFVMMALRFKRSVYGRQGYLTMTLPVTSHQILLSKWTSALIWYFFAGVATLLSAMLICGIAVLPFLDEISFTEIYYNFMEMVDHVDFGYTLTLYLLEIPVNILCVFFAISVGQLFKDHRTIMSIVSYFVINMIVGLIATFLWLPLTVDFMTLPLGVVGPNIYINIILQLILGIGFYFGTHHIMTKKLNLQ